MQKNTVPSLPDLPQLVLEAVDSESEVDPALLVIRVSWALCFTELRIRALTLPSQSGCCPRHTQSIHLLPQCSRMPSTRREQVEGLLMGESALYIEQRRPVQAYGLHSQSRSRPAASTHRARAVQSRPAASTSKVRALQSNTGVGSELL